MIFAPNRALIVDDERISRKMVQFVLEQKGFQCDWAEDGHEALDRIAEHSYDVVVTDLLMPRMNGGELVIRLCQLPSAPVIVVHTSVLEPEVMDGLKREGVHEIVCKPADYTQMADRIQTLVNRQRSRQQAITRWRFWRRTLAAAKSNPATRLVGHADECIQTSASRRETFRFGIILLASLLFGLGWGDSLSPHISAICKLFSLCGVAFYFSLELVAYYRDQNRAMLLRHAAERRLSRERLRDNECVKASDTKSARLLAMAD